MKKHNEKRLKSAKPNIKIPENFTNKVMSEIKDIQPKSKLASFLNWKPMVATGSLAILVLLVGVLVFNNKSNQELANNDQSNDVGESVILRDDNKLDDSFELSDLDVDDLNVDENLELPDDPSINQDIPRDINLASEEVAIQIQSIEAEMANFGDESAFDDSGLSDSSL